ncbi:MULTISPECIES: hypothetical protein [unclassified Sulfurospirillum]|uniref:hypothetical protein n=1 Tax=unclassified Sulfurospirillum TaxID=2618290 RepID=UPI000508376B|nr:MULTISPECIES: hypothetical protein [unclassified Sulfurospirillum]KFL33890.1 hypothetical protein JU57_08215 [Sulfurospirillum sp. SCADC]
METSTRYQTNVSLMKQLQPNSDRTAMQSSYSEDFEAIYHEAVQSDVKLSTAKAFLSHLSEDELSTLQHYTGLANEINVSSLSDEGAYNLLMHDAEKYDFNGDGMVQDGIANKSSMISTTMSDAMKASYVSALNSLDERERFDAMTAVTLTNATSALSSVEETSTSTIATPFTYDLLAARIDAMLHPTQGAYTSPEIKETIAKFWENFQSSYNA